MKESFNPILLFIWSFVVVLLIIGAGIIFSKTKKQPEKEDFVIGYVGPLTGDASAFGFNVKKAIELAKKDLEADDYRLIYADTKCRADEVEKGIQKLLNEGAQAIIGEVCSGATLAAIPYAEANEIVMISPASTSTELDSVSPYFFRTISSDSNQALFAAKLLNEREVKEIAIVYSNESYGKSFFDALKREFEELGGVVLSGVAIEQESIDVESDLKELLKSDPKVVFIASNSPISAAASLIELRKNGQEIQFFGSEALKADSFLSDAKKSAEGATIISLPEDDKNFMRKYKAEFGVKPGLFSSQAYDAFTVIFRAVESGNSNGDDMASFVRGVDFKGVSGRIKFSEKGDISRVYSTYEVKDGKFVKQN